MEKNILFFFIIFTLTSCSNYNKIAKAIINKNYNNLSYTLIHKNKVFFDNDTTEIKYKVYLKKNNEDTLYGYNFILENNNSYIINFNNKTYFFYPKKKIYYVIKPFYSKYNDYILPNNKLEKITNSLEIKKNKKKGLIIIKKKNKNFKEFTNIYSKHILSIKDKQYSKIIKNVDYKFTNQYDVFAFTNFDYSSIINIENKLNLLRSNYFEKKLSKKKKRNIVEYNSEINFKGFDIKENKNIELKSLYGKIIILDYWYMSCYACIKTIPFINKLNETYSRNDIIVLGVNIIDKSKNSMLNKFAKDNSMNYPIIITDENPLKINSFPTIVLINKQGKIIFSYSGYNKEKEKELQRIIEGLLINDN